MIGILFSPKVLIVLGLLFGFALAKRLYHRRQARLRRQRFTHPSVPGDLLTGDRTWIVFTTPYCASCEPVVEQLKAFDPAGSVVKVDATRRVDLARAFSVRTAPTVLLADADGTVLERLVGADTVRAHVARAAA